MDALTTLFETSFRNNAEGYDFRTLPAELRNRIYEYVVIEDGPVRLNQRKSRPGITQVCKHTRQDSLPIYFGRNTFRYSVANLEYTALVEWVDLLSEQDVRGLKQLVILCAGRVLHDLELPSFPEWHEPIVQLYLKNFSPTQISWQVRYHTTISPNHNCTAWVQEADSMVLSRAKVIFARHVLTPLLKANRLFDANNPPQEQQIVQLPTHISSTDFIPNAEIPQPDLSVLRHLRPWWADHPDNPIHWYKRYVEDLKMDWAQHQEIIQDAMDSQRRWDNKYSHMIEDDRDPILYDRYISELRRHRSSHRYQ